MKRFPMLMIVVFMIVYLVGCSSGGSGDDYYGDANLSDNLAFLDISDAEILYIRNGSSGSQYKSTDGKRLHPGYSKNSLMKIKESGLVEEVKKRNKNHEIINEYENNYYDSYQPTYIEKINNDYVFIGFAYHENYINDGFLCRKSDGAVYKMNYAPVLLCALGTTWKNSPLFSFDNYNNIYYIHERRENGDRSVIKLNLNSLTSQIISYSGDKWIEYCESDNEGNVAYRGWTSSTNANIKRIKTNSGALINFEASEFWKGLDGKIYISDYSKIKKLNITPENNIEYISYGDGSGGFGFQYHNSYKLKIADCIYIIDGTSGYIYEVYNPSSNPRKVNLTGLNLENLYTATASDDDYFIAGKNTSMQNFLIKVNPETDNFTQLLGNDYEVYDMSAIDDEVTFNALRMSDGKKILATVPCSGGAVTVLDEESDAEITYLERIR